jgi:hypothetical protein
MIIPVIVKKGKARKYLKLAVSDLKKKPKRISKYLVLNLKEYKQAKASNQLSQAKLVTKVADDSKKAHGD